MALRSASFQHRIEVPVGADGRAAVCRTLVVTWMRRGAIVKNRRGPWLSGLIAALIGAVWMIGQVIGGVVSMITDTLSLHISDGPR